MRYTVLGQVMFCALMGMVVAAEHGYAAPELDHRVDLARERFFKGTDPTYTQPFILADLSLDPDINRHFKNFSGDISGRYISMISRMPEAERPSDFRQLVAKALTYQHADGRFGRQDLRFAADEIGKEHMALLWGNGRFLVGLIDYYEVYKDPAVLKSAVKLADFLISVIDECSQPEAQERVKTLGFMGPICFTQMVEGLVLISGHVDDPKYLDAVDAIYPQLPPREVAIHSHGYFTTLRGVMLAYEQTGQQKYLDFAKGLYDDFIDSPHYLIYGGTREGFGHKNLDEGCSEADFFKLSWQLWQATGDVEYLEYMEKCLFNQYYHNQYPSGDFGYQLLHSDEYIGRGTRKAYYCCNMHCLQFLYDFQDGMIVEPMQDGYHIHFLVDHAWQDQDNAFAMAKTTHDERMAYQITVQKAADTPLRLAIRRPTWAKHLAVLLNGAPYQVDLDQAFIEIKRTWHANDTVTLVFDYTYQFFDEAKRPLTAADCHGDFKAYLYYGPYLMGVNRNVFPDFNPEVDVIHLNKPRTDAPVRPGTNLPEAYLGFETQRATPVTLCPLAEMAYEEEGTMQVWFQFHQ